MSSAAYKVPWLARLFHSFPHLDLTFQLTNSTFNPEGPRYREALLFWGALPVLWLLVTLLVFLIYFCYRCCQKDAEKKKRGTCLPWAMAITAVIACGAVGVGFYGNEDAHKGVMRFADAGEDADSTIHYMQDQINEVQNNINKTVDRQLLDLKKLFRRHQRLNATLQAELQKLTDMARGFTGEILNSVKLIDSKAQRVDLSHAVYSTKDYGYWRWVGTILLLCWEILLCLLLLFGIGRSSKCTLLMFCAFGIFTLVLCWVSAGLHLGASVGLGDFCVQPDVFFQKIGTEDMDKDIVRYYIKCNKEVKNPFSGSLKNALDSVTSANNTVNTAIEMAVKHIDRSEVQPKINQVQTALHNTVLNIQELTALVQCTTLHKDYTNAIEGVCYLALPGVAYLLLSSVVTGLLLTFLVLLASCAWRHFGKRKGYREIDEEETFFPRPDNASPSYYSFPRGRHSNPREHVPMHRRSSPPPAYSTNEFYRQYVDVNSQSDAEHSQHSAANETHA